MSDLSAKVRHIDEHFLSEKHANMADVADSIWSNRLTDCQMPPYTPNW